MGNIDVLLSPSQQCKKKKLKALRGVMTAKLQQ